MLEFKALNRDPTAVSCTQQEVAEESKRVWQFIIEREIEAPDRFQAIQTYRRVMQSGNQCSI